MAPGPGVVESRAKLADPKSESLASHLSLHGYRERRRTLVHLCGLQKNPASSLYDNYYGT